MSIQECFHQAMEEFDMYNSKNPSAVREVAALSRFLELLKELDIELKYTGEEEEETEDE